MITWLSERLQNPWARFAVSIFIFGWLIWIAWIENRHYRNMSSMVAKQFAELKNDHARAEIAMKLLASQVLKNTQETHQSTEAVRNLPDVPDQKP